MQISGWPDSDLKQVAGDVEQLGLQQNVYELDRFGLTVVPPEKLAADDLVNVALERLLDVHEKRTGVRPDLEAGRTHAGVFLPTLYAFLHEDDVFVHLMMHPVAQTLLSVLLGKSCLYGSVQAFIKGPADAEANQPLERQLRSGIRTDDLQLGLHTDLIMQPEPFASEPQVANVTWLLTDYTKDNGALAFVPGSNRLRRHPRNGEAAGLAVPVEAPRGSLVVFPSNTWHGSYPRVTPGLRIGVVYAFVRSYLDRFEMPDGTVPGHLRDRYGARLDTLLGAGLTHWGPDGPDPQKMARRQLRVSAYR